MTQPTISLAEGERIISLADSISIIDNYPALTLRLYDRLDDDPVRDEVTPEDVGRLIIIEPLQQATAWALLEAGATFPWHLMPDRARLEDADPEGELYENATSLFAAVDELPGVGFAIASKLLHLKRPSFFPILDSQVQRLYRRAAAGAYDRSIVWKTRQPTWKHLYWAAIRTDLIKEDNVTALDDLRCRLVAEHTESCEVGGRRRRAAALDNLRLLDILAWGVTKPLGS